MQRLWLWALTLPLAVAGSEVAHSVAYRLVIPGAAQRGEVLKETGHDYFSYFPLAAGFAGALLLLALARRVVLARRGVLGARPSAGWVAAVPVLTFFLQEHLERLISEGAIPWGAALEPTFLPGLLLQLPMALLAYALVRLLLRGAEALGLALAKPAPQVPLLRPLLIPTPAQADAGPRKPVLALRCAGRAPPRLSLAR